MLVRHGHVVAEGWWRPYSADRPHLLYSLSKSFTSTAAAFTEAAGLLDLNETMVSHFPEFEADITDAKSGGAAHPRVRPANLSSEWRRVGNLHICVWPSLDLRHYAASG